MNAQGRPISEKKPKILKITRRGELESIRVEPYRYANQFVKWRAQHGFDLPSFDELEKIGKPKELRILSRMVSLRLYLSGDVWVQWRFSPGFIWDLASVPKIARGLVGNDDIELQEAALIHDANYSGHSLGSDTRGLDITNWLFYQHMKFRGARFRAWLAYIAVNGVIGRSRFQHAPKRGASTLPFVNFTHGTY